MVRTTLIPSGGPHREIGVNVMITIARIDFP